MPCDLQNSPEAATWKWSAIGMLIFDTKESKLVTMGLETGSLVLYVPRKQKKKRLHGCMLASCHWPNQEDR
jgi:hypothetical protein